MSGVERVTRDEPIVVRRGHRRILCWTDWPAADRAAWEAACTPPASVLDDGGAAAAWRPRSQISVQGAYAGWLAFLAHRGALTLAAEPAARITAEQVRAYHAELHHRVTATTAAGYLKHLGMAAAVMFPLADWSWLRAFVASARRKIPPSRSKVARLVSPPVLLDLARRLMAEATSMAPDDGIAAARRYRDGLLIATLTLLPLRRGNLMGLELGRDLMSHNGRWTISIPGTETKNHRPIQTGFPAALTAALEIYLSVHRPVLLSGRRETGVTGGLWLSQFGCPLVPHRAWCIITRHTRERLGVAVHPHLFRDCAASFLGDADPEHVRMAAPLLGHTSFATTERYYIVAGSRTALSRHHDALLARRARLATRSTHRPEER